MLLIIDIHLSVLVATLTRRYNDPIPLSHRCSPRHLHWNLLKLPHELADLLLKGVFGDVP